MAVKWATTLDPYAATDLTLPGPFILNTATIAMGSPGVFGTGQYVSVTSAAVGDQLYAQPAGGPFTTFFWGGRILINNASNGVTLCNFIDSGVTQQGQLLVTNTGAISYKTGATTYSAGPGTMPLGTWHAVAIKLVLATGATGTVTIQVDQVQVLNQTSVITAQTTNGMTFFGLEATGNGPVWYDDLYLLDTSGAQNNTFYSYSPRGELHMPTGVGHVSAWAVQPNTDVAWQATSEIPEDGDATYIFDNTVNDATAMALSASTSLSSIAFVQAGACARLDNSGTRTFSVGVGNGSTESYAAPVTPTTAYSYFYDLLDTNPLTSSAWVIGDLSTLQVAVKIVS